MNLKQQVLEDVHHIVERRQKPIDISKFKKVLQVSLEKVVNTKFSKVAKFVGRQAGAIRVEVDTSKIDKPNVASYPSYFPNTDTNAVAKLISELWRDVAKKRGYSLYAVLAPENFSVYGLDKKSVWTFDFEPNYGKIINITYPIYRIVDSQEDAKVARIGFIPRSGQRSLGYAYNDRVYFLTTLKVAIEYAKSLLVNAHKSISIYEVDVTNYKQAKFYADVEFMWDDDFDGPYEEQGADIKPSESINTSVWTYSNIPPNLITKIDQIETTHD